ncbi:MAG: hypothetical protein FJX72_18355 [Armatimonadetes bacterium]|nr:hypothetical protein [Armatimonadota bacterium]
MCKLPDLKDYLAQTQEERDETTWQFMHDMLLTWRSWVKIVAIVGGLLGTASSIGVGSMWRAGDAREERVNELSRRMDAAIIRMEATGEALKTMYAKGDRRYAADSTWRVEVLRRLERMERRR